jgi:hypothetical protein
VHFVDASRAFEDVADTLYHDPCHFGPKGNEIIAGMVVPHFLARVLTRATAGGALPGAETGSSGAR